MFILNILARPLHKARIYAGSDARNCTKFTHIVTQFVQSLILPKIDVRTHIGFVCGILCRIISTDGI